MMTIAFAAVSVAFLLLLSMGYPKTAETFGIAIGLVAAAVVALLASSEAYAKLIRWSE